MALSIMNAYCLVVALIVLPTVVPQLENVCNNVNCGKGKCEAAPGEIINFKCICDAGWKRTPSNDTDNDDLQFLPCVIPNCSVNYSCMSSAPVAPTVRNNESFLDPCFWTYCGEGTCNKNTSTGSIGHSCDCNPGYSNLLHISAFPCYSDCALGLDCEHLGIPVPRTTTLTTVDNDNQAMAFLPEKFPWAAILLSSAMALWQ